MVLVEDLDPEDYGLPPLAVQHDIQILPRKTDGKLKTRLFQIAQQVIVSMLEGGASRCKKPKTEQQPPPSPQNIQKFK